MLQKINLNLIIYSIIYFCTQNTNIIYLNNNEILDNGNDNYEKKKFIYLLFFVEPKNSYKYSNLIHLRFFNSKYLQCLYKINLKEKNINCLFSLPEKITTLLLSETESINFKQFGIKYFNEIAFLFIVNVWLKNTKNICKYIKKKLDNVHFKQHRAYFLFYFSILDTYVEPFFSDLKVKGITLVFKGKLGKGGNSRKQTLFYKNGAYSLSNKNLKMERNKWDIWTKTGSVGCTMQIFYIKYDNFFKYLSIYLYNYFNIYTIYY